MGFPDRIERTVELDHPPEKVWAALTTAEGLGTWFGDAGARIDLRPGGAAEMSCDGGFTVQMRGERVEAPTGVGYTWQAKGRVGAPPVSGSPWRVRGLPEAAPRRTYVEFTLEPAGQGTRLTVVETGFAQ